MASLLKAKIFLYKLRVYGKEKLSFYVDLVLFKCNFPVRKNKNLPNTVLFTGEQLPPRIPRMAKWIKRQSDYNIVLLCHRRGFIEKFSDNCFDEVILYRNEWHLRRILRKLKGVELVHGFAPKSHFPNIVRASLNKPYIHDMQDVYSIYYTGKITLKWLEKELPHEIECLQKADGIVAHSMEVNVGLRALKLKKKPATIFFPLYCDNDFFQNAPHELNLDNLHMVYVGGVAGSFRSPHQYGNIQFHETIEQLSRQNIHFHIYPSPSTHRADYEEYEAIAKTNPFFHFHPPVAQQELPKELSKYDFGIHTGYVNHKVHKQSALKYKYCTTLKIFNFVEAGIPVICSENLVYQSWILKKMGVDYTINEDDLENLKRFISQVDYNETRRVLIEKREKMSLRNNTERLLAFYKKISHG